MTGKLTIDIQNRIFDICNARDLTLAEVQSPQNRKAAETRLSIVAMLRTHNISICVIAEILNTGFEEVLSMVRSPDVKARVSSDIQAIMNEEIRSPTRRQGMV